MLNISAKTDYGLLFMVALSQRDRRQHVGVHALAAEHRLPYRFLSQAAHLLKQARLVEAKEGVRGGYRLSRPPASISIGDVVRALEGPIGLVRCSTAARAACPSRRHCLLPSFWSDVQGALVSALDRITLADLVHSGRQP